MSRYREPAKELPVSGHYDVIVAGGGCAGMTAAMAAARCGARTLVIEQLPYFGGTATASLMANIVGIRNQVPPDDLQVCRGLGEEFILNLLERGGAGHSRNAYASAQRTDRKGDLSYSYAFDTELFKKTALDMVKAAGAEILFHTWFSDVIMDGDTLRGVIVENKSGRQALYGKVIVDCTGDGDAAARAGAEFWQTRGTEAKRLNDCLMYKVTGFDPDTDFPSCIFGDEMVIWGPSPGAHNGADGRELSEMEVTVRQAVYDHLAEIKRRYPSMKNAHIVDTGAYLGVRQTRFIEGEYRLTGEDVLRGAAFPDGVAMGANPVIQYYGYRRFLEHEGYEIPYRCLVPKRLENLLVAGRCMSSDQIAYESWRAMAHVFSIGEAAGTAAALSAQAGTPPRQLDVTDLRRQLTKQGAEIGQGRRNRPCV